MGCEIWYILFGQFDNFILTVKVSIVIDGEKKPYSELNLFQILDFQHGFYDGHIIPQFGNCRGKLDISTSLNLF